jgi:hypothetical protein
MEGDSPAFTAVAISVFPKMLSQAKHQAGEPNNEENNGEPKGEHRPALGEKAMVLADDRRQVQKDGNSPPGGSDLLELLGQASNNEQGHRGRGQGGYEKDDRRWRQANDS